MPGYTVALLVRYLSRWLNAARLCVPIRERMSCTTLLSTNWSDFVEAFNSPCFAGNPAMKKLAIGRQEGCFRLHHLCNFYGTGGESKSDLELFHRPASRYFISRKSLEFRLSGRLF
ncbi:hypothetical protein GE09DRAFT_279904 [Coniochaeta sp. 2T2.1]|nr:hypothetical protein GE09DRAFT_279904 [Coniochaeta sp. 2T2.1]